MAIGIWREFASVLFSPVRYNGLVRRVSGGGSMGWVMYIISDQYCSLFTMAPTLVGPWSCGHPGGGSLTHSYLTEKTRTNMSARSATGVE